MGKPPTDSRMGSLERWFSFYQRGERDGKKKGI
jgi:hypothetical protein